MKRIFISQPYSGKQSQDIERMRTLLTEISNRVLGDSTEIIDQYHVEDDESIAKYEDGTNPKSIYQLGRSIQMMNTADIVLFAPGWKDSKGCVVEMSVVERYGIEHYTSIADFINTYNATKKDECVDLIRKTIINTKGEEFLKNWEVEYIETHK